jgi:hypothetical protein
VISGILIVIAIAMITVFFVAMTITSVICGYERDQSFEREKEAVSPPFWLLLSLLVGGILIILVLFITLIWSLFV